MAMIRRSPPSDVTRRLVIVAGASSLCVGSLALQWTSPVRAASSGAERTAHFEEALRALLAGRTPVEGGVTVELPEIAENGNFVPIAITVDSPMTADNYVKAVHLLSSGNPVAPVATFRFSPLNARARVLSRMRLARTQDVVVVAEHSNGALHSATTFVKVTIGGCAS